MSNTIRNDIKQLAATIETLARNVQTELDKNGDLLGVSNELVRNNVAFTFALGQFYEVQQAGSTKTVKATTVANPNAAKNYHNLRDSNGRFRRA